MLGAFYPFYRNVSDLLVTRFHLAQLKQHNADDAISQEYYIWPSVTQAAKNAIDIRYVLVSW